MLPHDIKGVFLYIEPPNQTPIINDCGPDSFVLNPKLINDCGPDSSID